MSLRPDDLKRAEESVARNRAALELEFDGWVQRKRDSVASVRVLGAVVAAGFVIGGVLRRRRPVAAPAVVPTAGAGLLSILAGVAMSALRAQYAPSLSTLPGLLMRRPPPGSVDRPSRTVARGGAGSAGVTPGSRSPR